MKELKFITVVWVILLLFNVLSTTSCSEEHPSLEMTSSGTIALCMERAGGDSYLYDKCLDRQIEAQKKINSLIDSLSPSSYAIEVIEKLDKCVEMNTDSENRTDRTEVASCMGLGKPFDSI